MRINIVNELLGTKYPLPDYATDGSAGIDLRAMLNTSITLGYNEVKMIGSGIAIHLPKSHAGFLFPRSGLGMCGIGLANFVGVIDCDYTQEIKMLIKNYNDDPYTINPGDRVCQLVIVPYHKVRFEWVYEPVNPGEHKGFGSTGVG